jgi:hypothetical protein
MRLKKLGVQIGFVCLMWSVPLQAQDESLDWLNNYKEAIAEAKQTHKPIFLEYRCEA